MYLCMGVDVCVCVSQKQQHAWEAAQRGEQGVVELCEVPDTVAVTAALNVPLISHQSLLQSLEEETTAYSAISYSQLCLSAIKPPI